MMLSGDIQEEIQALIEQMTPDERQEALKDAHSACAYAQIKYAREGDLRGEDELAFSKAVETIVRIEGFEKGKGVFWRARQRVKIAHAYLKWVFQSDP